MRQLSMWSLSKSYTTETQNATETQKILLCVSVVFLCFCGVVFSIERDPVTLSVVAVNPSTEKTQVVPVRIDLPQEVTPKDILDPGEMVIEYDDEHGLYYVYKKDIALAPKETRVFQVTVKDVWFVPDDQLDSLKEYTQILLNKLKGSQYEESSSKVAETIFQRIDEIKKMQEDETISRKARIGAYRINLQTMAQIKEDLARMERLLTFTGTPPVPVMMEESSVKSDAPSKTTTWLVIFLIMTFVGILAGQVFFTWHRQAQLTKGALLESKKSAFPDEKENLS